MTTAKKGAERHVDLSALVKAAFHEGQADAALRAAKILTKAFADRGATAGEIGWVIDFLVKRSDECSEEAVEWLTKVEDNGAEIREAVNRSLKRSAKRAKRKGASR